MTLDSMLKTERERLTKKIAAIDQLLAVDGGAVTARKTTMGHKVSAAVREKIRRTQKARWAKIRAGKK
jgi:hypothetical protein